MIKTILKRLVEGIPITEDPYYDLANELHISKTELLAILQQQIKHHEILKLRAILNYEKLGYSVNALIAMQLDDIEKFCKLFGRMKNISHCYERIPTVEFPYNLFIVVHFQKEDNMHSLLQKLKQYNIKHVVLRTLKVYKRTRSDL